MHHFAPTKRAPLRSGAGPLARNIGLAPSGSIAVVFRKAPRTSLRRLQGQAADRQDRTMTAGAEGLEVPPVASHLMHSLRSIGYTTQAAVADIIDNSLGAEATRIEIDFAHTPRAFVSVIDDGVGMSRDALLQAMRYGSRDPREVRSGNDLGRFGLGLKTASLSQCRRLTVATLQSGRLSLAVWDVDECERRGGWWLLTPESSAISQDVIDALRSNGHGTAVIWENLDRLLGSSTASERRALDDTMTATSRSSGPLLSIAFLNGSLGRRVSMTVNGLALPAFDPFLEGHQRGQALHAETFPYRRSCCHGIAIRTAVSV